MIEAASREFAAHGVLSSRLYFDSFDYAPDSPARQRTAPSPNPDRRRIAPREWGPDAVLAQARRHACAGHQPMQVLNAAAQRR